MRERGLPAPGLRGVGSLLGGPRGAAAASPGRGATSGSGSRIGRRGGRAAGGSVGDARKRLHGAAADHTPRPCLGGRRRGLLASTTGRGARAEATAPSWSISSGGGRSSSCPAARDRPWLRGCAVTPGSPSWPGTARRQSRTGRDGGGAGRVAGGGPLAPASQHPPGGGALAGTIPRPPATPARRRWGLPARPAPVRLQEDRCGDRRRRREPGPRAAPPDVGGAPPSPGGRDPGRDRPGHGPRARHRAQARPRPGPSPSARHRDRAEAGSIHTSPTSHAAWLRAARTPWRCGERCRSSATRARPAKGSAPKPSAARRHFAAGLEHDGAAVRAALTTPGSNAQAEGQITRLNLIKRRTSGRAGFELLRRRMLLAP